MSQVESSSKNELDVGTYTYKLNGHLQICGNPNLPRWPPLCCLLAVDMKICLFFAFSFDTIMAYWDVFDQL